MKSGEFMSVACSSLAASSVVYLTSRAFDQALSVGLLNGTTLCVLNDLFDENTSGYKRVAWITAILGFAYLFQNQILIQSNVLNPTRSLSRKTFFFALVSSTCTSLIPSLFSFVRQNLFQEPKAKQKERPNSSTTPTSNSSTNLTSPTLIEQPPQPSSSHIGSHSEAEKHVQSQEPIKKPLTKTVSWAASINTYGSSPSLSEPNLEQSLRLTSHLSEKDLSQSSRKRSNTFTAPTDEHRFKKEKLLEASGHFIDSGLSIQKTSHFYEENDKMILAAIFQGYGKDQDAATHAANRLPDLFLKTLKENNDNVFNTFPTVCSTLRDSYSGRNGTSALICYIDRIRWEAHTIILGHSQGTIYRKTNTQIRTPYPLTINQYPLLIQSKSRFSNSKPKPTPQYPTRYNIEPGDLLILCSDKSSKCLSKVPINRIIQDRKTDDLLTELVKRQKRPKKGPRNSKEFIFAIEIQ